MFTKKEWTNRVSEFPARRNLVKEDGTTEVVTVERNEGTVGNEGDAFDADTMNDLEERIANAFVSIGEAFSLESAVLTIDLDKLSGVDDGT